MMRYFLAELTIYTALLRLRHNGVVTAAQDYLSFSRLLGSQINSVFHYGIDWSLCKPCPGGWQPHSEANHPHHPPGRCDAFCSIFLGIHQVQGSDWPCQSHSHRVSMEIAVFHAHIFPKRVFNATGSMAPLIFATTLRNPKDSLRVSQIQIAT
jgi:hypothetical protein